MHLIFVTLSTAGALVSPSGCGDGQVVSWLRATLRPAMAHPTQHFAAPRARVVSKDLRALLERHLRQCDETAHGPARQSLRARLGELEASTAREYDQLRQARPLALEKCGGPTRDACAAEVTAAFRARETALVNNAGAAEAELRRELESLRLEFPETRRLVDGIEVLDAYSKALGAKLSERPGRVVRAIAVSTGQDYNSSWQLVLDVRHGDQNFDYLTRTFVNLYGPVDDETLRQVRSLGEAEALTAPERVATVNGGTLEEAVADRRAGRGVTWLTRAAPDGARRMTQVGVLDHVTVKMLKPELRPR